VCEKHKDLDDIWQGCLDCQGVGECKKNCKECDSQEVCRESSCIEFRILRYRNFLKHEEEKSIREWDAEMKRKQFKVIGG